MGVSRVQEPGGPEPWSLEREESQALMEVSWEPSRSINAGKQSGKLDNQEKTGEEETAESMTLLFIIKEQYTMKL